MHTAHGCLQPQRQLYMIMTILYSYYHFTTSSHVATKLHMTTVLYMLFNIKHQPAMPRGKAPESCKIPLASTQHPAAHFNSWDPSDLNLADKELSLAQAQLHHGNPIALHGHTCHIWNFTSTVIHTQALLIACLLAKMLTTTRLVPSPGYSKHCNSSQWLHCCQKYKTLLQLQAGQCFF